MEEERWLQGALHGDTMAFSHLVDQYKTPVYNLAFRMLGNPEDAEDAAQETFLRAYSQMKSYDPSRKFSSWLLSITSHYCIDNLRRRRFSWLPVDILDSVDWLWGDTNQPEQQALEGEDRDEVRRLLHVLPPKYRLVVVLRYWHDMSYEEIAEATKMSVAAVKTRLHRAREMLAEHVESEGGLRGAHDLGIDALSSEAGATRSYKRHELVAHS
jgi:RNA polymerase sigma-70 factor, ECF subfamily